jgi:hypothetical protein
MVYKRRPDNIEEGDLNLTADRSATLSGLSATLSD